MEKDAKKEITCLAIEERIFDGEELAAVNARELWRALGSKRQFGNWIKDRLSYFEAERDYVSKKLVNVENSGRFAPTEYWVTVDVAKHFASLERNERGKKIRRILLDCEKHIQREKIAKEYVKTLISVLGFEEIIYRVSVYDELLKIAKENGYTED